MEKKMNRERLEQVKQIARNSYSKDDFNFHILPVVENSLLLAKKFPEADKEVIVIASFLHDIGRAISRGDFQKENEHHLTGVEESSKILKDIGYSEEFIEKVKHCVLTHRGRREPNPETIEAKIIASADAMAHFDTFLDLFTFFLKTTDSFKEAVIEIEQKFERNWNKKLMPEAKEIVGEKYNAIMLIIKSTKEHFDKEN